LPSGRGGFPRDGEQLPDIDGARRRRRRGAETRGAPAQHRPLGHRDQGFSGFRRAADPRDGREPRLRDRPDGDRQARGYRCGDAPGAELPTRPLRMGRAAGSAEGARHSAADAGSHRFRSLSSEPLAATAGSSRASVAGARVIFAAMTDTADFEARSWLFAPGDSDRKMEKAAAGPADIVLFDLEDAVAEAEKPEARQRISSFLTAAQPPERARLWVRIN